MIHSGAKKYECFSLTGFFSRVNVSVKARTYPSSSLQLYSFRARSLKRQNYTNPQDLPINIIGRALTMTRKCVLDFFGYIPLVKKASCRLVQEPT